MIRAVLAVVAIALCASLAHAEMNATARAKLDAGHAHFGAGRYSDALSEYEAAYRIDPDPDILFAIAQSERKLGQCHLALPHYREYLASRSDFPVEVQKLIAECWMQLPPPEANKPCPSAAVVASEERLAWYKNPVMGVVLVGTASALVGTAFLIESSSTRHQAANALYSDDFDRLLEEATGERRIGATLLISGAVLAAGAGAYHLWTRSPSKHPTAMITTDGQSVAYARSF